MENKNENIHPNRVGIPQFCILRLLSGQVFNFDFCILKLN